MVQSLPLDDIKDESTPHPHKGKKEEGKDAKMEISGQDVVHPASQAKEDSTGEVVVTNIHTLKTRFIRVTDYFNSFDMSFIGP